MYHSLSSSEVLAVQVRLADGDGKELKPANLEPLEGSHGRVFIFWGDAQW